MVETNIGFYSDIGKELPDNCIAVEVGSHLGLSANHLVNCFKKANKTIRLYCIDIWWGGAYANQYFDTSKDKADHGNYNQFLLNSKNNLDCIVPIKMLSGEAPSLFLNNYFDLIYIDAAHTYDFVKSDLELWYPKLKSKGIIAGHDYRSAWPDVPKAVDEFVAKNNISNLKIEHTDNWIIRK